MNSYLFVFSTSLDDLCLHLKNREMFLRLQAMLTWRRLHLYEGNSISSPGILLSQRSHARLPHDEFIWIGIRIHMNPNPAGSGITLQTNHLLAFLVEPKPLCWKTSCRGTSLTLAPWWLTSRKKIVWNWRILPCDSSFVSKTSLQQLYDIVAEAFRRRRLIYGRRHNKICQQGTDPSSAGSSPRHFFFLSISAILLCETGDMSATFLHVC